MTNRWGSEVQATRWRHRGYRDVRLLLGAVLVLGSAAFGAALLAAQDDRTAYWSVAADVRGGEPVRADQLVSSPVRVDDAQAAHLLAADDDLPARLEELRWARDIPAGALVERSAMMADRGAAADLPLMVADGAAPDDLARGDRVDIWVGPAPGGDQRQKASRVLENVPVLSAGGADLAAGAATRTVVADVSGATLTAAMMGTLSTGHVTLVRVS